jgi:hypothetical protein
VHKRKDFFQKPFCSLFISSFLESVSEPNNVMALLSHSELVIVRNVLFVRDDKSNDNYLGGDDGSQTCHVISPSCPGLGCRLPGCFSRSEK